MVAIRGIEDQRTADVPIPTLAAYGLLSCSCGRLGDDHVPWPPRSCVRDTAARACASRAAFAAHNSPADPDTIRGNEAVCGVRETGVRDAKPKPRGPCVPA